MKTLLTFALLALIGLLHHNSAIRCPVGPFVAAPLLTRHCCPKVTRFRLPRRKIQNVERSHSRCPVTAIIVTTVCEMQICLDDSWTWAKKLLTDFEKSTANNKPPSAPFNVSPCRN